MSFSAEAALMVRRTKAPEGGFPVLILKIMPRPRHNFNFTVAGHKVMDHCGFRGLWHPVAVGSPFLLSVTRLASRSTLQGVAIRMPLFQVFHTSSINRFANYIL